MLLSPNPQIQPAFKKDLARLFNGNKQIRLVAVNTNQNRAPNSGLRKGHAQVTNQLTVVLLDGQAVKGYGVKEVAEEIVRDRERQSFSPANRPDADYAVFLTPTSCSPLPMRKTAKGFLKLTAPESLRRFRLK